MGIFGKKKADEFENLHNDNLFNDDDDIVVPNSRKATGMHRVGHNTGNAPHALTVGEVMGSAVEDTSSEQRPQPDSVYEKMKDRETIMTGIDDDYVPSWATPSVGESSTDDIHSSSATVPEVKKSDIEPAVPEIIEVTPAPVREVSTSPSADAFLERCRMAVEKATVEDSASIVSAAENNEPDAIKPDTAIVAAAEEEKSESAPARSVDDIIRMLRGESSDGRADETALSKPTVLAVGADDTADGTPMSDSTESDDLHREVKVEVEVIPTDSDSDIMHTAEDSKPEDDGDVRIYGKIVRGTVVQHTPDGDVEASEFIRGAKVSQDTIVADDKTVMFGDLGDIISKKADDDMVAHSSFDDDDFDDDDFDTPYYETEDERLADIDDYKTLDDSARLRVEYSNKKTKHKTVAIFTTVITFLMLVTASGLVSFLPSATLMLIDIVLLAAAVVMNIDIFADFKNLLKMRPSFDSCTAVASSLVLLQNLLSYFVFDLKHAGLGVVAAILLTVNRYAGLMKSSRILKGLEFISTSQPKRAVISVGGNNAKVVASGAVEGEVLALCDRKTENVRDYLKNCGYDSPLDRKLKVMFTVVASVALAAGIIVSLISGFGAGLSALTSTLCLLWPASAVLTCELPMYLACRKASRYGAMIAGFKGAYELNLANVATVSSSDLFPEGSVKLYNMKTLGENEMGHTLTSAAAVAIAANSPLSSIFKSIIGNTGEKLPKVNGVQYEDKMGISGWIGEETILIGNRNLMQGHNIAVPPASVDQKILKAGYFPVYIAVGGVNCLLFLVQYETDPAVTYELQQLCNTGMTVVVDPKDPNTTDAMICDYFGLPSDAVKVMNHNGRVSYERITAPTDSVSTCAAFSSDVCGFFSSITSAIRLGSIYSVLTAIFVIAAVLGAVLTVYLSLTGKADLVNPLTVGGFQILFTAISALVAKLKSK